MFQLNPNRSEVPTTAQPDSAEGFLAGAAVEVVTPFQATHWGTQEMTVRDPDGRLWSLQAPRHMNIAPDSSEVRTALWRALHVQLDAPPHLLADEIGLALAAPAPGWRDRPDMHPTGTRSYRASIVTRTRFVGDLVVEEGIGQYVLLGAGLDTFPQRHRELADHVRVFEIDQRGTQAWKRQRLEELGYGESEGRLERSALLLLASRCTALARASTVRAAPRNSTLPSGKLGHWPPAWLPETTLTLHLV